MPLYDVTFFHAANTNPDKLFGNVFGLDADDFNAAATWATDVGQLMATELDSSYTMSYARISTHGKDGVDFEPVQFNITGGHDDAGLPEPDFTIARVVGQAGTGRPAVKQLRHFLSDADVAGKLILSQRVDALNALFAAIQAEGNARIVVIHDDPVNQVVRDVVGWTTRPNVYSRQVSRKKRTAVKPNLLRAKFNGKTRR